MKKLVKVFGMVVVLTVLPVAFTGGSSGSSVAVGIRSVCADQEDCLYEIGSVCRGGDGELPNHKNKKAPGDS